MIAHNRPTSRIPDKPQPPKNDPLPWWLGLVLVGGIVGAVLVARTHSAIPLAAQWLGLAATALAWRTPFITKRLGGRWYGKGTAPVTITAVSFQGFALAANWHSTGWWWLALPVLAVWTTTVIGRSGNGANHRRRLQWRTAQQEVIEGAAPSSVERKIAQGLPLFTAALHKAHPNASITVARPTVQEDGTIRTEVRSDIPLNIDKVRWLAGDAFGYGQRDVEGFSANDESTGLYVLVLGRQEAPAMRPWDVEAPDIPPADEWPDLCFPLGWTTSGILWAPLNIHWMVAGITDSGKSNSLNVVIGNAIAMRTKTGQQRFGLALIDPKQTELYPWRDHALYYGDDAASIMDTLQRIEKLRQDRMATRRQAGLKKWDDALGPRVLLVIDEMAEAIKIAPNAAPIIETLARLARAEGIVLLIADQHPTDKSFPTIIKRNMPNVICHHVADGGAGRVALGENTTSKGFDPSDETIPQGGGVAKVAGVGTQWVQVFLEGDIPAVPQHAQLDPTTPRMPTSEPVAEVDRNPTNATNATTDPDTRTPRQIIEDNLFPDDPITAAALAVLAGCTPQNVSKILAKMATDGLAVRVRGGWVSAPSRDRAA